MVALMNEGGFDLVTASGDASLRLIAGKRVQPINTDLIPSWSTVDERLQNAPWHTVDGVHYGVPYSGAPNVLMYNTEVFKEPPTSLERGVREMTCPTASRTRAACRPMTARSTSPTPRST
jgi:putative spermidine/putrescine transport system substrate-binding protein